MSVHFRNVKGRRVLPATLDYLARTQPSRVYAAIPKAHDLSLGLREVTVEDVSRAVHACAWWIQVTYGRSASFETLAYVGLNDLRYAVVWFAAIKCGYKVLFFSARNTVAQNVSLLRQTQCSKLLYAAEVAPVADGLKDSLETSLGLDTRSIAPLEEWVTSFKEPYDYRKSFEEAKDDPIVVLQSSGSTGDPKPITCTNDSLAVNDRPLPPIEGRQLGGTALLDYEGGGYFYSPFPGSHLAGITALSWFPVFCKSASVVLGPADRPPSMDVVQSILTQAQPRVLYLPPIIIEGLTQIPSALEAMKNAESIIFAGGPLSRPVGDMLSKHCKLSSSYGSTELAAVSCLLPQERQDWAWLEWHPAYKAEMEPAVDGAYELILNRDKEADQYRAVASTILRTQPQFRSRDLFMRHPTRLGLWEFYARTDDVIVFSSGEKWNPVPSEGIIQSHPKLSGVLIIGDGRFQPAALLEPKESPDSSEALIEEVWAKIESANVESPRFGQLSRSKVAVVGSGSLKRAAKGTVVRKLATKQHADLIEALYTDDAPTRVSEFSGPQLAQSPDVKESVMTFVRQCVHSLPTTLGISDDMDFYIHGLDSLETLELARLLKRGLSGQYTSENLSFLSSHTVFAFPTIQRLSRAICTGLAGASELNGGLKEVGTASIERMIESFSNKLPVKRVARPSEPSQATALRIVLTGSTGWLGQRILLSLLSSPNIERVTCLDRSSKSARISADKVHSSLPTASFSKISFLQARLDASNFGLTPSEVSEVEGTDLIIHNAWKVNFNQSLDSFSGLVSSITNLTSWAAKQATKTPRIVFTSSVSCVANYACGTIPEAVVEDTSAPAHTGYAQSKYVAEHLLMRAAENAKVPVTILRVGQVAGDMRGIAAAPDWSAHITKEMRGWSKQEWLPALLQTSRYLGMVPNELPIEVDWVPANVAAGAVYELITFDLAHESDHATVYNVLNRNATTWSAILPGIQVSLSHNGNDNSRLLSVTYKEWVSALKSKQASIESSNLSTKAQLDATEHFPALKILPFFESLTEIEGTHSQQVRYSTAKASAASPSLANLEAVKPEWIQTWIQELGF